MCYVLARQLGPGQVRELGVHADAHNLGIDGPAVPQNIQIKQCGELATRVVTALVREGPPTEAGLPRQGLT